MAELIGFDKVLFVLAEAIKSELPNLTPGKKVLANWATLEANLYGISAILKYGKIINCFLFITLNFYLASKEKSFLLNDIIILVLQLPVDLTVVKQTCIKIIKASAPFIESKYN